MTSLLENYEQQYAVLSAEITSEIGKLGRVTGNSLDDRKELLQKIDSGLVEIYELLEQIGLEIRDADSNAKTGLNTRLQCYQAELERLKKEFVNAKSVKTSEFGQTTYDSSDFDEIGIREEQQRRLLDNSERIERAGNRLADGYRTILETEAIGTGVLQDLAQQREAIQRSRSRLRQANEELSRSSRIMNSMLMRSLRERAVLVGVIAIFVVVVSLSIYFSTSN